MTVTDAWSMEFRWKEQVIYWEGDHGFVFDGGWGVSPSVTHVPDAATWDAVVPGWMQGRCAVILERMTTEPGHVLRETPDYDSETIATRCVSR